MSAWTQEETDVLLTWYGRVKNSELQAMLPSKSKQAIYKKAYKLGLRVPKEVEYLNRSEAMSLRYQSRTTELLTQKGYKLIYSPSHPRADSHGFVFEHIVVFEKATGVAIPQGCCIHHLNGDKADNRIENLCLMTHGAHTVFHHSGRKQNAETRTKISIRAKERLADKRNHPRYKEVDVLKMLDMQKQGIPISRICEQLGINRTTFYKKVKEYKNA